MTFGTENTLEQSLHVSVFMQVCFLSTVRLSNWTLKITRILKLYQAIAPTLTRCHFLIKHTPKLIIFGTHNLQTFKHNTRINELLLMLFNIFPKLHRRNSEVTKITRHTVPNFLNLSTSLLTLFFIQHSGNCHKLPSAVTFTFCRLLIESLSSLLNVAVLIGSVTHNFQNLRYFWHPV